MKRHWYVKNKWENRVIGFATKTERDALARANPGLWIPIDSDDPLVRECQGQWKRIGDGAIGCYLK